MTVADIDNISRIFVTIDVSNNRVLIRADGRGIPFVKKGGEWMLASDFGSKFELTKIFSTEFIIQSVVHNTIRKKMESTVNFSLDLIKFHMKSLADNDTVKIMERRAIDVSATKPGVSVYLNNAKVSVNNFRDYIGLHCDDFTYEKVNSNWEIGIAYSQFGKENVLFANSVPTSKGKMRIPRFESRI